MRRAIPDGIDIVERRAAEFIDIYPVRACCARRDQRGDGGHDADADDHDFARHDRTIGQPDAGDFGVALDRFQRGFQPQIDAVGPVFAFVEARQIFARHTVQHAVLRLQHGHFAAQLA